MIRTSTLAAALLLLGSLAPARAQTIPAYPGGVRHVQLAGHSLAKYPWFENVNTFNQGENVEFAVDPTRLPFLVGKSADVYVVRWRRDLPAVKNPPPLFDAGGNGPKHVTFQSGNVQANTLVLSAGTLSGGGGLHLGVGYDVVVDLDQNGVLDAGDLIDGGIDRPGFWVVADVAVGGPLAVTETIYSGGTWLGEDLYYPTDIANLGSLPLVVVSHGNGHNYQWYDHIGYHLASWGCIVMSHENNTQPGIESASTTTIRNTDYLLGHLATIANGALVGHLDSHRIVWIGHSRGGEGVVRAYNRLVNNLYQPPPTTFVPSDIVLISSMAPTDFLGHVSSNMYDVPYHLWTAAADADVNGCANCDLCQTYQLHDRALGWRLSTTIEGAGHGDFHDSNGSVAQGPCLSGKAKTHLIQLGYMLPLVKWFTEGDDAATDFFWRQYETFHPISAPVSDPCVSVELMYRVGPGVPRFVIDDFETNPATNLSSSGGAVRGTVQGLAEGSANDANSAFTYLASDTFNSITLAGDDDTSHVGVFSFDGNADYELDFDIVPEARDAARWGWLSFRAAQRSRDPLTVAQLGDVTFVVTLRDGSGNASSVDIGTYGGGIEEPYQRTGCGQGAGWAAEFETIRIRMTDFLANGSPLDLTDIVAVDLHFGPAYGSPMGSLAIDDLEFTGN